MSVSVCLCLSVSLSLRSLLLLLLTTPPYGHPRAAFGGWVGCVPPFLAGGRRSARGVCWLKVVGGVGGTLADVAKVSVCEEEEEEED